MKAVILAAGRGVRLLPLTEDRPKPLIEIAGKPFLSYLLENLKKAGITKLCFVVGYKREKMMEYFLKNEVKCDIVFQEEQKGTGHAVGLAEDFAGKENFLLVMGDNLYSVEDLKNVQRPGNLCYIVGREAEKPELYGVLEEDSGYLREIREKPEKPESNLINTGLYKLTPEIFDALKKVKESERGEYEVTDAVNLLAREKKVKILKSESFWMDMGSKEDLEKIKGFLTRIK